MLQASTSSTSPKFPVPVDVSTDDITSEDSSQNKPLTVIHICKQQRLENGQLMHISKSTNHKSQKITMRFAMTKNAAILCVCGVHSQVFRVCGKTQQLSHSTVSNQSVTNCYVIWWLSSNHSAQMIYNLTKVKLSFKIVYCPVQRLTRKLRLFQMQRSNTRCDQILFPAWLTGLQWESNVGLSNVNSSP